MSIRLEAYTTVDGRRVYVVDKEKLDGDFWEISYPGQPYSSSPLQLYAGHMTRFKADDIASSMARVFEAGRQQAFRDIRALIGAK